MLELPWFRLTVEQYTDDHLVFARVAAAAVALDKFIVRREIVGLYRKFVEHQLDLIEDLGRRDGADPEYERVLREAEQEFLAVWFSEYDRVVREGEQELASQH